MKIRTMKSATSELPWVVLSPGNRTRLRFATLLELERLDPKRMD